MIDIYEAQKRIEEIKPYLNAAIEDVGKLKKYGSIEEIISSYSVIPWAVDFDNDRIILKVSYMRPFFLVLHFTRYSQIIDDIDVFDENEKEIEVLKPAEALVIHHIITKIEEQGIKKTIIAYIQKYLK